LGSPQTDYLQIVYNYALTPRTRIGTKHVFAIVESLPQVALDGPLGQKVCECNCFEAKETKFNPGEENELSTSLSNSTSRPRGERRAGSFLPVPGACRR
jgi:hypothetical protein